MLIGLSGLAHRPRKPSRRGAVDKWTVRAIARTGPLAVDNASRCQQRRPLPTCPQPSTTTTKITSGPTQLPSFGRYKASLVMHVVDSAETPLPLARPSQRGGWGTAGNPSAASFALSGRRAKMGRADAGSRRRALPLARWTSGASTTKPRNRNSLRKAPDVISMTSCCPVYGHKQDMPRTFTTPGRRLKCGLALGRPAAQSGRVKAR